MPTGLVLFGNTPDAFIQFTYLSILKIAQGQVGSHTVDLTSSMSTLNLILSLWAPNKAGLNIEANSKDVVIMRHQPNSQKFLKRSSNHYVSLKT